MLLARIALGRYQMHLNASVVVLLFAYLVNCALQIREAVQIRLSAQLVIGRLPTASNVSVVAMMSEITGGANLVSSVLKI